MQKIHICRRGTISVLNEIKKLIASGYAHDSPEVTALYETALGRTPTRTGNTPCSAPRTTATSAASDIIVDVANTSVNAIAHGKAVVSSVCKLEDEARKNIEDLRSVSAIFRLKSEWAEGGIDYAIDEDGKEIEFTQKWPRIDHIALQTTLTIAGGYKTLTPKEWHVELACIVDGVHAYNAETPLGMLRLVNLADIMNITINKEAIKRCTKFMVIVEGEATMVLDWYETYRSDGSDFYISLLDANVSSLHEFWLEIGGHHIIAAKTKGTSTVADITNNIMKLCTQNRGT